MEASIHITISGIIQTFSDMHANDDYFVQCDVESAGQQYSHSHRCLFVFSKHYMYVQLGGFIFPLTAFLLLTAAVVVVVVGYITEYKFTMEGKRCLIKLGI